MKKLLIASKDHSTVDSLRESFKTDYDIAEVYDSNTCLQRFQEERYEFLFIDILFLNELGASEGVYHYYNTLKIFWNIFPSVQIIILCTSDTLRKAVDAVRAGANNYLTYPVDKKEARYIIDTTIEALRMQFELDYLRDQFWRTDSLDIVRTNSIHMKSVLDKVKTVAAADTTVLITGETGTGKGVIANLIHNHSNRKNKQFISVHCGAIPENLIESEIFGHEKGAFTGAVKRKLGKFEIAHGGTIFLDEIGTMPLITQVKLLQIIQEKTFHRVGGEDSIKCDVRIIAASNTNLNAMVENGTFRNDLFYRLNVFPIELPPLRKRKEDITMLAEVFLDRLNKLYSKNIVRIHEDVLRAFESYPWPGNIRELENIIERAYLLETSKMLTPESFPSEILAMTEPVAEIPLNTTLTLAEMRKKSLDEIERNYLKEQMSNHKGKINETAKTAGVSTRQLHKLLTKYGIRKEEFKAKP